MDQMLCMKFCFYLNIHFMVERSFTCFERARKFKDVYSSGSGLFPCHLFWSPGRRLPRMTCVDTFPACRYFVFSKNGLSQMVLEILRKKLSSWWCEGHNAENGLLAPSGFSLSHLPQTLFPTSLNRCVVPAVFCQLFIAWMYQEKIIILIYNLTLQEV